MVVAARACLESYTAAMAEGEGPASNLFNGEAVVGDWVELEVGDDHWVDMLARMLCRQRRPRSVEDPLVRLCSWCSRATNREEEEAHGGITLSHMLPGPARRIGRSGGR